MPTYSFASRPFALDGMDLTRYLVDQSEREVVPTRLCETQTDTFTAQPPPATYVPLKSGVDKQTQVDDVGELFNFDEESVPLVEVIVRKTLEQALVEVNHEEELAELQRQMEDFEAQRHQELQWMKQQEDSVVQDYLQVRGVVEKMQQQLKRSREVKTKVAGLQMARQILPHCLHRLMSAWTSPEDQDAVANVVPRVVEAAADAARAYDESSYITDGKCRRVAGVVARLTVSVSLFRCVAELLAGAVEAFDAVSPSTRPDGAVKKLTVRLLRVQQEEVPRDVAVAGDEEAAPETREVATVAAVLSLAVEPRDTIPSLEHKVRQLLTTLRAPPPGSDNAEEEAAAPPVNPNDWYPAFVPLYNGIAAVVRSDFYERRGLPYVTLALDAQLSFFPLGVEAVTVDHVLA